jgi:hypothetical protein
MRTQKSNKIVTLLKASLFVVLASVSFGAMANPDYIGNPDRVDTIWVPGHCRGCCWSEGYYIKFSRPIPASDLMWIGPQYDRCGNYIEGHYYYRPWYHNGHYRVMCG